MNKTTQVRLEEKQRAARRERELEAELAQQEGREFIPYSPGWFRQVPIISCHHRVPTPPPPNLPTREAKAGRNHLKEEITPFLPTRIGERCIQTILNLGHAALLR
jgi:hypothetical protein